VIHRLRDQGNTLAIIEHNLDVIKTADWIVDLGPEGGAGGGQIIATGSPEEVAANPDSVTGKYLIPLLKPAKKKQSAVRRRNPVYAAGSPSISASSLPAGVS
jgi:excinuclease ABC subunit A